MRGGNSERHPGPNLGWHIDYVLGTTESSVNLAAALRDLLDLPGTPLRISNLLRDKLEMKRQTRRQRVEVDDVVGLP